MLRTTQLSAEQSGLDNDVGDATVAADPIVTLSPDAETKRLLKRAAAAKRQRTSRADAKANNGVEAISKKRKAEPGRQPAPRAAVRSKKEKAEPGRQPAAISDKQKLQPARHKRLPPAPPTDLERANAALFLFLWCSFRLDLRPCRSTRSRRWNGVESHHLQTCRDCTCMERYLHEAKHANIKVGAAREDVAGRCTSIFHNPNPWGKAVARARTKEKKAILAEAIRADIMASLVYHREADKEITAAGGGEPGGGGRPHVAIVQKPDPEARNPHRDCVQLREANRSLRVLGLSRISHVEACFAATFSGAAQFSDRKLGCVERSRPTLCRLCEPPCGSGTRESSWRSYMYVHRGTRRSSVITPRVLSPQELETVYAWVDEVPLSRPKKNFARDFSDGCLVAEIVAYHLPKLGLAPRKGWREPSFACGGVQFDKCKHSPLAHNVVLHLLLAAYMWYQSGRCIALRRSVPVGSRCAGRAALSLHADQCEQLCHVPKLRPEASQLESADVGGVGADWGANEPQRGRGHHRRAADAY